MAQYYQNHATINSRPAAPGIDLGILREPVLWKFTLLMAITYLVWSEKLTIVLDLSPSTARENLEVGGQKIKASLIPDFFSSTNSRKQKSGLPITTVELPSGSSGNSTFAIDPGFANRNGIDPEVASQSLDKCREYIARFAPVAIAEMHKFNIPASVILAQGLLESNAGESKLARSTNNHFGVKCFSKKCKKGHCINFTDDSHKDFFIKYSNIWGSYRAHSQFLKNSSRYSRLFKLEPTDYQSWARGLAKAGYATDTRYGEKLIALIKNLELEHFDHR